MFCEFVSEAAAKRDALLVKPAAAKNQVIRMLGRKLRAGYDVIWRVLAVAVDGHGAGNIRAVVENVVERRFQSHSLAEINDVPDDMAAVRVLTYPEIFSVFRFAAIVDENDLLKTGLPQLAHKGYHLVIRIQRRYDDSCVSIKCPHNLPL